ncbi:MAG TPA: hypothetical protein VMK12_01010 [Anaeromyxobacteraceae bacterium]|nr:hypothetical protein [Anaeromyxobacteraceae bacterium]
MKFELRNQHEDTLLERFSEVLPKGAGVTVLADRASANAARAVQRPDFAFIVPFRNAAVPDENGVTRLLAIGYAEKDVSARVTKARRPGCGRAQEMRSPDPLPPATPTRLAEIARHHGKRFPSRRDATRRAAASAWAVGDARRLGATVSCSRGFATRTLFLLGAVGSRLAFDALLNAHNRNADAYARNQRLLYSQWTATMPAERAPPLIATAANPSKL